MQFTKAEQKQIESRFDAMYKLLTKDKWIQGDEALDKDGDSIEPKEKGAVSFCLIGAVRYINGPTEEEIGALTAIQILIDTKELDHYLDEVMENEEFAATGDEVVDRAFALQDFAVQFSTEGADRKYGDIIVSWNDESGRTHTEVRAMLKRAQKLYGKIFKAWEVANEYDLMVGKLAKKAAAIKF